MRTIDEITANARPRSAFANGSEWDAWSASWCQRCQHYDTCPIIFVAMFQESTPAEWVDDQPGTLFRPYTCTEFTGVAA